MLIKWLEDEHGYSLVEVLAAIMMMALAILPMIRLVIRSVDTLRK